MYKKGCIKLTVTVETYDMSLHENSCKQQRNSCECDVEKFYFGKENCEMMFVDTN